MNKKVRKRLDVLKMKGLRNICNINRTDRIQNIRIRRMCNWNRGLVKRAEEGVLRWFGHLCRMDEARIPKKVFKSEVAGNRGRGRPKGRWMDGVKELLSIKGLTIEDGKILALDRSRWRRLVME